MTHNATQSSLGKWMLVYILPPILIIVLFIGGLLIAAKNFKPKNDEKEPELVVPPVETIIAKRQESIPIEVTSQGTVLPRIQTLIIAEVSGRIVDVSPDLYSGGFFKKGDILATVEDLDYQANVSSALSRQADAQLALDQEKANSAQAKEDWKEIGQGSEASELTLRIPQLRRAEANLHAANAAVAIAKRDLQRTQIVAPYDGRVQEKFIDVGQFVNARTSQVARVFSTDRAEIRLPLSLSDSNFIDVLEINHSGSKPTVRFTADNLEWTGYIDRSEGTIDPQSRLMYFVGVVDDPYARNADTVHPTMEIGRFVEASIVGRELSAGFRLPRKALRKNNTVYVVNDENRIEIRSVQVFKKNSDHVIIESNIKDGEVICMTSLEYAVDGMRVDTTSNDSPKSEKTAR